MDAQLAVGVAMEWEAAFRGHLAGVGISANSVKAYVQDVRAFATWFAEENGCGFAPGLITTVDLRGYRAWALAQKSGDGERPNLAPATWNRRRVALKKLCEWSVGVGLLSYNPYHEADMQRWVEEELPPRWLSTVDFKRFMRKVEQEANTASTDFGRWLAVRGQALVALMVYAGLREGEVVALNVGHVQMGERKGRVVVWKGKGEKKREVPLHTEALRAVGAWLEISGQKEGPLFVGKTGERLSTRTVERMVAEIGRLAGVEVTPHDLRATFAKRMVDKGVALTVVQKLMGHARLETTARYVTPGWEDFEDAVGRI